MLSDFDLSKQSGEPGGAPAGIKQSGPNGVSRILLIDARADDESDVLGGHEVLYCGLPDELVRWHRRHVTYPV